MIVASFFCLNICISRIKLIYNVTVLQFMLIIHHCVFIENWKCRTDMFFVYNNIYGDNLIITNVVCVIKVNRMIYVVDGECMKDVLFPCHIRL